MRWEPSGNEDVVVTTNGTVVQDPQPKRGERYSVFSYVPKQAGPQPLAAAGTDYPNEIHDYLLPQPDLDVTPLPAFGEPGRGRVHGGPLRAARSRSRSTVCSTTRPAR